MNEERFSGYIDYYNEMRGFGFIKSDDVNGSYFLHISNIASGLAKSGRIVTFTVGKTSRGACALDVNVLGGGR